MKELKDLKLMDMSKLDSLDETKLSEELKISEKKLFTLRMKLNVGELKQTHLVKFLRRYISKIKTIVSAKGFKA